MNESQVVREIVEGLKAGLGARAEVMKHCDRVTAGVPDLSVTSRGLTWWIEVKLFDSLCPTPSEVRKTFDPLQLARMRSLEKNGLALYLVAFHRDGDRETQLAILKPNTVAQVFSSAGPLIHDDGVLKPDLVGPFKKSMALLVETIESAGQIR